MCLTSLPQDEIGAAALTATPTEITVLKPSVGRSRCPVRIHSRRDWLYMNHNKLSRKLKTRDSERHRIDSQLWKSEIKQATYFPASEIDTNRRTQSVKETLDEFMKRGGSIQKIDYHDSLFNYDDLLKYYAALNRNKYNAGELQALESLQELGIGYEYQKPMRPYVVDFYLPDYNLILEIDGKGHTYTHRERKDKSRDTYFRNRGMKTLRIVSGEATPDRIRNSLSEILDEDFNGQ